MSISVIRAGVFDSIQDEGRPGYAIYGINPSGVMDIFAMKTANVLALNPFGSPVIEMHFPAPVLKFNQHALIGLAGADFEAVIHPAKGGNLAVGINKTIRVSPGSVLSFNKKIWGERVYLAVQGGFNLPQWFGSYSTNLKVNSGGFNGRRLKKGDELPLHAQSIGTKPHDKVFNWRAPGYETYSASGILHILLAPEWEWLEPGSQIFLTNREYTIQSQSDRMGILLNGLPLKLLHQEQLLSGGVQYGTIQLLPNGQMIILAADHPTTGGYPRIANIITADLPMLAQANAGTIIKFIKTSVDHAEDLLLAQHKQLELLQTSVRLRMREF